MKKLLFTLLLSTFGLSVAFAETALKINNFEADDVMSAITDNMGNIHFMSKDSNATQVVPQILKKEETAKESKIDNEEFSNGFGDLAVFNSRATASSSQSVAATSSSPQIEYVLGAGSTPGTLDMLVAKVPNSYCIDQYPYPKVEPIDGLLMYSTYIYEQNLSINNIANYYITRIGTGNITIWPNAWTEYASGNGPDLVTLFRFTTVQPYASDNDHVYRNNWQRPDEIADWVSDISQYGSSNLGCHMVVTPNGESIIPGYTYLWITMQQAIDNGDDLLYASNYKHNVFNFERHDSPIWTLYFDVREHGMTYIQKWLPF